MDFAQVYQKNIQPVLKFKVSEKREPIRITVDRRIGLSTHKSREDSLNMNRNFIGLWGLEIVEEGEGGSEQKYNFSKPFHPTHCFGFLFLPSMLQRFESLEPPVIHRQHI